MRKQVSIIICSLAMAALMATPASMVNAKATDVAAINTVTVNRDTTAATSEEATAASENTTAAGDSEENTSTQAGTTDTTAATTDEVMPGTSQSNALLIPLETKIFGTIEKSQNVWFSFHTGSEKGTAYYITTVNKSPGFRHIEITLIDELGNKVQGTCWVESTGGGYSLYSDTLEADTTYYLKMVVKDTRATDYSLIIRNPENTTTAYPTMGSIQEAEGAIGEGDAIAVGTDIDNAPILEVNTTIKGKIGEDEAVKYQWFAFTTGEAGDYAVSLTNDTVDSRELILGLFDKYGNKMLNTGWAESDGTTATLQTDKLQKDTIYYISIQQKDNKVQDYTLGIKGNVAEKKEQSALVFEKPFEINDTQVQFVANEATFIDEVKAKEVLKPVADAILEHPDNAVLIAGTTATDGTQESCIDLSNRRAEAVKKVLTDTYKVPDKQVKTIGLGYEADPFVRGKDIDSNGDFVESEARKNRRVVVLDVEDDIAKELLNSDK